MLNLLAIASFDLKSIFSNFKTEWQYYLTFLIVISIIILCISFFKKQEKFELQKTKKIVLISVFAALSVIANIFTFGTDTIKFSFVATICFIAGYLLGPISGISVGFIGDLIGGILAPSGPYNPIIALGASLWGFFPGVAFYYFKGNKYIKTIISFLISYLICSVLLNTTGVYFMYLSNSTKYPTLMTYIFARIPFTFITLSFNIIATILLLPALERIKKRLSNSALVTASQTL